VKAVILISAFFQIDQAKKLDSSFCERSENLSDEKPKTETCKRDWNTSLVPVPTYDPGICSNSLFKKSFSLHLYAHAPARFDEICSNQPEIFERLASGASSNRRIHLIAIFACTLLALIKQLLRNSLAGLLGPNVSNRHYSSSRKDDTSTAVVALSIISSHGRRGQRGKKLMQM